VWMGAVEKDQQAESSLFYQVYRLGLSSQTLKDWLCLCMSTRIVRLEKNITAGRQSLRHFAVKITPYNNSLPSYKGYK